MKRALLSKPIHPIEDYEQDMLAELDRQLARFDEPDKGAAWPVFLVLLVSVAVAFTVAAWALGRIVWGVVV